MVLMAVDIVIENGTEAGTEVTYPSRKSDLGV